MKKFFLSPIIDQLTGFGQVTALEMLQHLFRFNGLIDKIDLKKNSVKMMGPYNPDGPLACLIDKLKEGQEFSRSRVQIIADATMVSKGITILAQKSMFNDDIR